MGVGVEQINLKNKIQIKLKNTQKVAVTSSIFNDETTVTVNVVYCTTVAYIPLQLK